MANTDMIFQQTELTYLFSINSLKKFYELYLFFTASPFYYHPEENQPLDQNKNMVSPRPSDFFLFAENFQGPFPVPTIIFP